jgi:hypothetical protein
VSNWNEGDSLRFLSPSGDGTYSKIDKKMTISLYLSIILETLRTIKKYQLMKKLEIGQTLLKIMN